ncbi:hypothetical protein AVEN_262287-1 [Araneus ventricosus]|uniref:Uncharacterized protein n=1 Tax=Araneus ventricosus TaxID=182803 RepID=A0A4Y2R458_ARAVE|nr:hypothetical protein AVEN_262287-1 [Araneus ventricosus]
MGKSEGTRGLSPEITAELEGPLYYRQETERYRESEVTPTPSQSKSNSRQSQLYQGPVRTDRWTQSSSLKREQCYSHGKVASQQCKSYGWEEGLARVKHGDLKGTL